MKKLLKKTIASAAALAVAFGVTVAAQAAPTYLLDFSGIPVAVQEGGDRTQAPFSTERDGFVVTIAPGASQPNFEWASSGNLRTGGIGQAGTGFVDANGGNRAMRTTVELTAPITIAIEGLSVAAPGATVVVRFGEQEVTMEFPQVPGPERVEGGLHVVEHTFATGSGIIEFDWPWAADGVAPGRLGVRSIAITEGAAAAAPTPQQPAPQQPPVGGAQPVLPEGDKAADVPPVVDPPPAVTPPPTSDSATVIYAIGAAVLLAVAALVVLKKKAIQ
jgi:hypothetical protein